MLRWTQPTRPRKWLLLGGDSEELRQNDFLVLPENMGPNIANMAKGTRKVILNQSCYLTFNYYSLKEDEMRTPYNDPDVVAVLINSEDSLKYLQYVFPNLPITRFHLSVDPDVFAFQADKKRQICFTPKKNDEVVRQVINILKFRKALRDFKLVQFSGISQKEVARIMQESALYLSFSQYEGFGLPLVEAMACGCIVIGYHAGGGKEFLKREFSYPVESGDVLGLARKVEEVIREYDVDSNLFMGIAKAASEFVRETYPPQQEESDIINFWLKLLSSF